MPEPGATSQRTKLRVENLSDLVFGLALSLGSIILISHSVDTPLDLVTNLALFGFSFLIVIWIWSGYTRIMAVLPIEIRGTFVLNIVLLFCVAVEPYLFYVLFEGPFSLLDFASSVYAFNGGAMMFILAGLTRLLVGEERKGLPTPGFSMKRFRRAMYAEISSGLVFWASAFPFFWVHDPFGSFVRFDMWYAVFLVFFVIIRLRSREARG